MAPPKRKSTGGRITPKGTQPGQVPHIQREGSLASRPTTSRSEHDSSESATGVHSSSRYTPPTPMDVYESPKWVPILMFALIGLGLLAVISRYLIWKDTQVPVLVGLGLILAGLFTATKWH